MRGDRAGKGQETGGDVPDRDTRTRSDCPGLADQGQIDRVNVS